jgi:hypothetical protein
VDADRPHSGPFIDRFNLSEVHALTPNDVVDLKLLKGPEGPYVFYLSPVKCTLLAVGGSFQFAATTSAFISSPKSAFWTPMRATSAPRDLSFRKPSR